MAAFDPLSLCKESEEELERFQKANPDVRRAFVTDWETLLRGMVERIGEFLQTKDRIPAELVDTELNLADGGDPLAAGRTYAARARRLHQDALAYASLPKLKVTDPEQLKAREEAIELCRLWWTRALKAKVGTKIAVRIKKAEKEGIGVL